MTLVELARPVSKEWSNMLTIVYPNRPHVTVSAHAGYSTRLLRAAK